MKTLITLKGLPSSGKSTWAKQLQKNEPGKWKVVNKDQLRLMIDDGEWSHQNEEFITQVQENLIRAALKKGFNVVSDNTNFSPRIYKRLCEIAAEIGDVMVVEKNFEVSPEECIARDAKRTGKACVGAKVIMDMYKKYNLRYGYPQPKQEYFAKKGGENVGASAVAANKQNETLDKAIISDIDGTLALFEGKRSPYDASKSDIIDSPNVPVVETIKLFYEKGYKIIFCSGREDKYREPTIRFIEKHLPGVAYELFMRKSGDFRKDAIIKEEIYRGNIEGKYYIEFVLDDRSVVVDKWRELGLVCFQVAPGDF